MMTAMDVGRLPPALVRSGRIELWLETRLPDEAARGALLADLCRQLPASAGPVDLDELAEESARARHRSRPPHFDLPAMAMMAAQMCGEAAVFTRMTEIESIDV
jgi:SpoVK/Ycf46/Vps4 family AAA+-type ATPase